ncbi:UNVERIFIED_CONTAM: hypothetical protein Sindi_2459400 [Sesamum indicum]
MSPSGNGRLAGGWCTREPGQVGSIRRIHFSSLATQSSKSECGDCGGDNDGAVDSLAPDGPSIVWWVLEPKSKTWPLLWPLALTTTCVACSGPLTLKRTMEGLDYSCALGFDVPR